MNSKFTFKIEHRLTVGVDIGIKELAVTSDGKVFSNPKAYRPAELACGAYKPLESHLKAVTKQEIDGKSELVQLSLF